MSTTPLLERLTDAPSSLSLADRLSSPTPLAPLSLAERLADDPSYIPDSPTTMEEALVPIDTRPPSRAHSEPSEVEVDIGMIGRDLATPAGFSMFNRTNPNHHRYGQKIDMPDSTSRWPHYIQFIVDTDTHNHYVYATRDDLRHGKYSWVLEAAPFTGCTSPGVNETNLQVLLGTEDQRLGVDIALNTINDKGVIVDTDRLREIAMEDVDLTRREHELVEERTRWRVRNAEVRDCLIKARAHSRIHPYLNHTALIPNHYRPETMCIGGVTLATQFPIPTNAAYGGTLCHNTTTTMRKLVVHPDPLHSPTTAVSVNNYNPNTRSGIAWHAGTAIIAGDATTLAKTATTPTPSASPSQNA